MRTDDVLESPGRVVVSSERRKRKKRMRFAVANKAYIAVTLGAAIELKEQVAKPCSSAAKRGALRLSAAGKIGGGGGDEESLRMIMFLSCWGPS